MEEKIVLKRGTALKTVLVVQSLIGYLVLMNMLTAKLIFKYSGFLGSNFNLRIL